MPRKFLSPIADIIEEARNGRMFVLVDDEDRENEGDLVIPAQMATPAAVNFMAKHGRGLICLTLTSKRAEELGLALMSDRNGTRHQTAFTVSIEACEGVSTGISAHDRAHTISVAIDPTKGRNDLVTPGHVFPLIARDGGVLVRSGHTEAAVDVARLAGLIPAGVICEIMNDDGTMARLPELVEFAIAHGIKIGTIADLIAYRLKNDKLVTKTAEMDFISRHGGEFKLRSYKSIIDSAEHLVLMKGDVNIDQPVLVRMHSFNIFEDMLDEVSSRSGQFSRALDIIGKEGRGVIVVIRDARPANLSDFILHRTGVRQAPPAELKNYGIGAQILMELGVHRMILLSNTERHVVGLEGYGLEIVKRQPIPTGDSHDR